MDLINLTGLFVIFFYHIVSSGPVRLKTVAWFFVSLHPVAVSAAFKVCAVCESVAVAQLAVLARTAKAIVIFPRHINSPPNDFIYCLTVRSGVLL